MIDNQEMAFSALLAWCRSKLANTFGSSIQESVDFPSQVSEQPALFLVHLSADDTWSGTVLQRSEIEVQAWIFTTSGSDDVPGQKLRQLAYSLRSALSPDVMGNPVTLNGQVRWARVEGRTEYYPGLPGGQAVAIVPVKVLLP